MTTESKPKRPAGVDVYLGPVLSQRVKEIAAKEGVSQSAVCRDIIASSLETRSAPGTVPAEVVARIERQIKEQGAHLQRLEVFGAINISLLAMAQSAGQLPTQPTKEELAKLLSAALKTSGSVLRSEHLNAVVHARQEG